MYKECIFAEAPGYEPAFARFEPNLVPFYTNPQKFAMEPFQIYGNLYYVGNKKVCMHLVDTGEGLILFDTGYGCDFGMLLESVRTLGFDPHDIRIVIHSHGHFDHMNGGRAMRETYGAVIYMSKVDTELLRERPERALCHFGPDKYPEICWPDVEIEDGQCITLGNTTVRCVLTPGHTHGTMTYFFDAVSDGKPLHVAYMGGCGFLTVYREYCRRMGMEDNKLEKMGESIRKVYDEPVDIVIGNHPAQNDTIGKREWMLEHPDSNPFINPKAWHVFLDTLNEYRLRLLNSDRY